MNNNNKNQVLFATKLQLILCIALCPIAIAAYALLREFTQIDSIFIAIAVALLYLLAVSITWINREKSTEAAPAPGLNNLLNETSVKAIKNSASPAIILDSYGTLLWYNTAMHKILDEHGNFIGSNLMTLLESPLVKENFHYF